MIGNKRILIVASTFPSSETEHVPFFVKDQIEAIKEIKSSLEFTVLAPHNETSNTGYINEHEAYTEYRFHYFLPRKFETLTNQGILPALRQNKFRLVLTPFFVLAEFIALFRLARKENPSVIYAHWFTPQAINSALVSKFLGIPFVFTTHASDVSVLKKLPFSRILTKWVCSRANAYSAVSNRTAKKLKAMFNKEEWEKTYKKKLSIIPMGTTPVSKVVSVSAVSRTQEKYRLPSDKEFVLFIGRLAEKKGVKYLLEAFSNLSDATKQKLHLIVAGDGQLRDSLMELSESLGVKNVTFTGYIQGKDKDSLFAMSDYICLPSIIDSSGDAEGLPVVMMEALAHGKIVIASNVTGAEDIIEDGSSGFIFAQQSIEELSAKLAKAVDLSIDDKKSIQRQSKKLAKQFDWKLVAKRHLKELFGMSYE